MNKEKDINHLIDLYKENRYELISDNILRIDRNEVIKKTRNHKILFTCTCENAEKTGNLGFCRHKQFFLMFPYLDAINRNINTELNFFSMLSRMEKNIDRKRDIDIFVDRLKEIRRVKL